MTQRIGRSPPAWFLLSRVQGAPLKPKHARQRPKLAWSHERHVQGHERLGCRHTRRLGLRRTSVHVAPFCVAGHFVCQACKLQRQGGFKRVAELLSEVEAKLVEDQERMATKGGFRGQCSSLAEGDSTPATDQNRKGSTCASGSAACRLPLSRVRSETRLGPSRGLPPGRWGFLLGRSC